VVKLAYRPAGKQEIAALERQVSDLRLDEPRQNSLEQDEISDKIAAIDVALNSLCRAWATSDPANRRLLSGTAVQTLRGLGTGDTEAPSTEAAISTQAAPISPAERLGDPGDCPDRHAWAVKILAMLTFKEASGSEIAVDELHQAARAASALLPKMSNSAQWGAFLGLARLARAAKQFPPVGMLTPGSSTPADAVDGLDLKSWVAQESPVLGHRFWLQPWAQSLADAGLVSCIVLYDECANDELVASALIEKNHHTIVVSRRLDASVVGKVAAAGAIFFPSGEGEEKLSDAIMNNPLLHTISAVAENRPSASRWATETRAFRRAPVANPNSAAGLVNKKPIGARS